MEQLRNFGDRRSQGVCVHCGGPDESKDHIPSKVLLDEPFPDNMHICACCRRCNNDLSADEEYLACLLECVLVGEADPSIIERAKISTLLSTKPPLLARLRNAKLKTIITTVWSVENDRVRKVVLKLARGHAAYELNDPQIDEPSYLDFRPLPTLTDTEHEAFETSPSELLPAWPEVGSRGMQRILVGSTEYESGWIATQDCNYRFPVSQDGGLTVKIVLREYLACQVNWD